MTYSIVWFKRDLRVQDHEPLFQAAQQGPVLCIYVVEPSLWRHGDAATQHYQFVVECLHGLALALQKRGGRLHIVHGEVPEVLERLNALAPFTRIYSHEETGNDLTYQRDCAIAHWCRDKGINWQEFAQFGVVRRLKNRDDWLTHWERQVNLPVAASARLPFLQSVPLPWFEPALPSASQLGLAQLDPPLRQRGGRQLGLQVLQSFLTERCGQYRGGISSPLSAPTACSRLSPYLAYGCLSMREVVQATRRQQANLPESAKYQKNGLTAFISRLYWHCHFIQKLESEPELEYLNLHRGYDGLRENDWNDEHFEVLVAGRTGWPLVDACVVMLRETGWLNFRMRAMLVSVAAYPLWLDWRPVGQWLAQQFLDYEPGIHWSQMQMQSGTTGINVPRVYNPIKQAQDHDPQGHFVRRWLPAMRRVPDAWLFEPWRMPADLQARYGVVVGVDIAEPRVDLEVATRLAKQRLFALLAKPDIKAAKSAIVEKHGSRKRPDRAVKRQTTGLDSSQLTLEF